MRDKVLHKKPSIAWRKFLKGLGYTIGASIVAYSLNYLGSIQVSPDQAIYVGLLISLLQAVKKALERYDPKKDR